MYHIISYGVLHMQVGEQPRSGDVHRSGDSPRSRYVMYLDRRRIIRIKVASGKHIFLWYNSNCDWQRWGCVSSAYPILLWWSWECALYLIIIIKPEVWIIIHCLGLGHETMVCAVCLTMFLCIGITMTIWAIFITPVTPFQFMGLSLTTWQSGCPFQKEWKPYISSHILNLMATYDDKQYFHLTANFVI